MLVSLEPPYSRKNRNLSGLLSVNVVKAHFALMKSQTVYMTHHRRGTAGNVIAALCSFFLPGLGQLLQGRIIGAAFFFASTLVLYQLLITWPIALLIHLWAIINAAMYNPR